MKTKLIVALTIPGLKGLSQESAKQIKEVNQLWGGYYSNIVLNEKWVNLAAGIK